MGQMPYFGAKLSCLGSVVQPLCKQMIVCCESRFDWVPAPIVAHLVDAIVTVLDEDVVNAFPARTIGPSAVDQNNIPNKMLLVLR
jgi:hypothetical protein